MVLKKILLPMALVAMLMPFTATHAQTDVKPSGIKIINNQGGPTYSRKVATSIGIYTKDGTVPGISKHTGTWGGQTYNYLEIDSAGENSTFLQVDYAGNSGTDDTPKTFNNFYDTALTSSGYHWAGAINAGFFAARSSDPMYGYPVGGIKIDNIWQTYSSAGTNNEPWETKPEHGTGFVTAYLNKNNQFELIYNGWDPTQQQIFDDVNTPTWDWNGKHTKYSDGVSGAYTLMVNGDSTVHWGKDDYRGTNYWNYTGTGTTLLGQKSNGNYILLTTVGGISANQQVALMKELGCTDAIRFDGGGSTQMAFDEGLIVDHFFINKTSRKMIEGQPLNTSDISMDVYMKDGTYHYATLQDAPQAEVKVFDSQMNEVKDFSKASAGTYTLKVLMNGLEQQMAITVEAKEFTVNFEDGFGNVIHTEVVQNGSAAVGPTTVPSKDGYTFKGWDIDLNNIKSNITVKALYTPIEYQINLNLNGGTATNPQTYNIETNTITIANPIKEGYNFTGWSSQEHPEKKMNLIINKGSVGDINYIANYEPIVYNIKYLFDIPNVNNGNSISTYTIEDVIPLAAPTAEGYNFIGWYMDGTPIPDGVIPLGSVGDKEMYGEFELAKYTIVFNDSSVQDITFDITQLPVQLPTLVRDGSEFAGWYDNPELTGQPITQVETVGNKSLYQKWTQKTYTVQYTDALGQVIGTESVEHGKAAVKDLTKEGYTVTLDKQVNNIVSDITVVVTYTPIKYQISYHDVENHNNPTEFTIEDNIVLGNPTKEGYNFIGWYLEPTFVTSISDIKVGTVGEKNLYAKWEAKDVNYTISHETNTGTILETENLQGKYGQEITVQPKQFKGYTSPSIQTVVLKENTVVKMVYSPVEYKVNVTDGIVNKPTATMGEEITLKFNRPNSRFISWNSDVLLKDSNLSETTFIMPDSDVNISAVYQDIKEVKEIDLSVPQPVKGELLGYLGIIPGNLVTMTYEWYKDGNAVTGTCLSNITYTIKIHIMPRQDVSIAKDVVINFNKEKMTGEIGPDGSLTIEHTFPPTEKNVYNIKFVDFDGSILKEETVAEGEKATAPAEPIREGYIFKGWDKTFDSITQDLVVRAVYNAKVYNVEFINFDGSKIETQKVEHGQSAIAPVIERRGYTLTGWDKAFENITSDTVVTAQYEINTYTITYDYKNNGPATYTVEDNVQLDIPVKADYVFEGWYTEPEFINKVEKFSNSIGNINLYAKWNRENCNVTYVYGYDNISEAVKVPYNQPLQALPELNREGYIFTGWYLNNQPFDLKQPITEDITLVGKWKVNEITNYTASISKSEFWLDENITNDLITVTAHYLDGTEKILKIEEFTTDIPEQAFKTPGEYQISILNGKNEQIATVTITTKAREGLTETIVLEQIKEIKVNDTVDNSYFKLTSLLPDGTSTEISGNEFSISKVNTLIPSKLTVTATYKDMTTSVDVNVVGYKEVRFTVTNGKWNSGSDEETVVTFKFTEEKQQTPFVYPDAGNKPNKGYRAGRWDKEIKETISYDSPSSYNYTYVVDEAQTKILKYTVNYFAENENKPRYSETFEKEIWVNDPFTELNVDREKINLVSKISGMIFDNAKTGNIPTKVKSGDVINIYYAVDKNNDRTPDKYQKALTFKVKNGKWDNGLATPVTMIVNLSRDGILDENGTAKIEVPSVGNTPNKGYTAGSWNVKPNNIIDKNSKENYEYGYVKDQKATKETQYTVRHVVGNTVLLSKEYKAKVWVNEAQPKIKVENGSLALTNHKGYRFSQIKGNYKEGEYVPTGTVIDLVYEPDLTVTKEITYFVEYFQEGVSIHKEKIVKKIWIHEKDEVIPNKIDTNLQLKKGYKVKEVKVPDKIKNNDVIRVDYIKDVNQTKSLKYHVNYYLNNLHSSEHSYEVVKKVWINEPSNKLIIEKDIDISPNKFAGYVYDHCEPSRNPNKGDIVESGTTINVYYKAKKQEVRNTVNVIFKVKNGKWNDGSIQDKNVEFILNSKGETSGDSPSVGNKPEEFYMEGKWSPEIPKTFKAKDSGKVYTYTYEPEKLDYTVSIYLDNQFIPSLSQVKQATYGETVTISPKRVIEHNGMKYEVISDSHSIKVDQKDLTVNVNYKSIGKASQNNKEEKKSNLSIFIIIGIVILLPPIVILILLLAKKMKEETEE